MRVCGGVAAGRCGNAAERRCGGAAAAAGVGVCGCVGVCRCGAARRLSVAHLVVAVCKESKREVRRSEDAYYTRSHPKFEFSTSKKPTKKEPSLAAVNPQ